MVKPQGTGENCDQLNSQRAVVTGLRLRTVIQWEFFREGGELFEDQRLGDNKVWQERVLQHDIRKARKLRIIDAKESL